MCKTQLLETRESPTFKDWGRHVVSRTCGGGEPMVEVPEVADDQQHNADISVTVGGSERSLSPTWIGLIGYRIRMNKILLTDQLP